MLSTITLVPVVALLSGAAVGCLATRGWFRPRLLDVQRRVEQLLMSHSHTNEMLLQARRQAEILQKEVELARRTGSVPRAPVLPTPDAREVAMADIVGATVDRAFADTLMQAPPQPREHGDLVA